MRRFHEDFINFEASMKSADISQFQAFQDFISKSYKNSGLWENKQMHLFITFN